MTSAASVTTGSATSTPSFSFYVMASRVDLIRGASRFGDAVTVAGPSGPQVVKKLRSTGFEKAVLFDGLGYAGKGLPPVDRWVAAQLSAGADRALLPGTFVSWDKADPTSIEALVEEQALLAERFHATMLLALDARWLIRATDSLSRVLEGVRQPVAIILADRGDPLADGRAVAGVRWLSARVPQLSLLRSDHGALGAVAFGAEHASIGLTTTTRHFATSAMRPYRLPDDSARLFVRRLLDWFRAAEIAGWSTAGADFTCRLACCGGAALGRYLDKDLDATWHNMNALADFADHVLGADAATRSAEFLNECRAATSRYGLAGFHGPQDPKAQLTSWVLS
jgi:hypothetical protein